MLFNVAGLTVKVNQIIYTNMDMGCCCAYDIYRIQFLKRGGREDSQEGGTPSPYPSPMQKNPKCSTAYNSGTAQWKNLFQFHIVEQHKSY